MHIVSAYAKAMQLEKIKLHVHAQMHEINEQGMPRMANWLARETSSLEFARSLAMASISASVYNLKRG